MVSANSCARSEIEQVGAGAVGGGGARAAFGRAVGIGGNEVTGAARGSPAHDTIALRGGMRPGGAVPAGARRRAGSLDIGLDPVDYVALHKTAADAYRDGCRRHLPPLR